MTEILEIRRLKPTISHARSLILSDYFDDETFQMIINSRPIQYRRHEVLVKPILEPPLPIQYVSAPSFTTVIENQPLVYQRAYTPNLIEERPVALYRSCETPVRRFVPVQSSNEKNVHLPKHAKKLVNRFLNNLEQAHDHQHNDGNDSDSSIDGCNVCRQLRSAMNDRCDHSKNCKVCNLLGKSDLCISNTNKQGKHVHVIETFPSNNKPIVEPTGQGPLYPIGYNTFVDPNTGFTYTYDPNWQYNPNPVYIPSNTVPVVTESSYPSTMDKATYTRMPSEDKKSKSNNKTVFVHTSRNPTPPTPKVIIEQPRRRHRLPRKKTTIIEERTIQVPRTKTINYT